MGLFAHKMEKFASARAENKNISLLDYDYESFVDVSKRVMQGRSRKQQQQVVREVLLSMFPPGAPAQTNRLAKLKQCKLDARSEQWLSQAHESLVTICCGDIHGQFHDLAELFRIRGKASWTRIPHERNTRLENMCWRIWNLARTKKQLCEFVG